MVFTDFSALHYVEFLCRLSFGNFGEIQVINIAKLKYPWSAITVIVLHEIHSPELPSSVSDRQALP